MTEEETRTKVRNVLDQISKDFIYALFKKGVVFRHGRDANEAIVAVIYTCGFDIDPEKIRDAK